MVVEQANRTEPSEGDMQRYMRWHTYRSDVWTLQQMSLCQHEGSRWEFGGQSSFLTTTMCAGATRPEKLREQRGAARSGEKRRATRNGGGRRGTPRGDEAWSGSEVVKDLSLRFCSNRTG